MKQISTTARQKYDISTTLNCNLFASTLSKNIISFSFGSEQLGKSAREHLKASRSRATNCNVNEWSCVCLKSQKYNNLNAIIDVEFAFSADSQILWNRDKLHEKNWICWMSLISTGPNGNFRSRFFDVVKFVCIQQPEIVSPNVFVLLGLRSPPPPPMLAELSCVALINTALWNCLLCFIVASETWLVWKTIRQPQSWM